jgi:hypothetical protein
MKIKNSTLRKTILSSLCVTAFVCAAFGQNKQFDNIGLRTTDNPTSIAARHDSGRYFWEMPALSDSPDNLLPAWTPAAAIPTTAALRYGFADSGDIFYIVGGLNGSFATSTALRQYNVLTNVWTNLAPVPASSEGASATYFNNKIYATQGTAGTGFYIYDITLNSWTTGPPVPAGPTDRYGAAMGSFNNKVFVVGGGSVAPSSADVRVYDIATGLWSAGTPIPSNYLFGGYVQSGQYLYCVGSYTTSAATNLTTTYRLDMTTAPGTWTTGPVFTPGRADFALAVFNNKLYAIGGDANGGGFFDSSTQVDQLDLTTFPAGTWVASPDNLPSARQANQAGFNSTVTGSKIWSTGGYNGAGITENLFRSTAPTAASVSVSGIVTDGKSGIARATVSITGTGGIVRTVKTNSFGYFQLDGIGAGQTYILSAAAKSYTFAPQVLTVNDSISDLEFTAQ